MWRVWSLNFKYKFEVAGKFEVYSLIIVIEFRGFGT
jgi:hypothetical protein